MESKGSLLCLQDLSTCSYNVHTLIPSILISSFHLRLDWQKRLYHYCQQEMHVATWKLCELGGLQPAEDNPKKILLEQC
jgi:hypothetical protein